MNTIWKIANNSKQNLKKLKRITKWTTSGKNLDTTVLWCKFPKSVDCVLFELNDEYFAGCLFWLQTYLYQTIHIHVCTCLIFMIACFFRMSRRKIYLHTKITETLYIFRQKKTNPSYNKCLLKFGWSLSRLLVSNLQRICL